MQIDLDHPTVDDLIRELTALPADLRAQRILIFGREGNTTPIASIQIWRITAHDEEPAVILDY